MKSWMDSNGSTISLTPHTFKWQETDRGLSQKIPVLLSEPESSLEKWLHRNSIRMEEQAETEGQAGASFSPRTHILHTDKY